MGHLSAPRKTCQDNDQHGNMDTDGLGAGPILLSLDPLYSSATDFLSVAASSNERRSFGLSARSRLAPRKTVS